MVTTTHAIERLDTARHDRRSFCCGEEKIDKYLHTVAGQSQKQGYSSTFVLVEITAPALSETLAPIVGFVTLVATTVPLCDGPEPSPEGQSAEPGAPERRQSTAAVPVLLLAQMGVATSHAGRDLGRVLIKHSCHCALEMERLAGCSALVVDALKDSLIPYYEKRGFIRLPEMQRRLHIPIKTLRKILG